MEFQPYKKTHFLKKNIKPISILFLTVLIIFAVCSQNDTHVPTSHDVVAAKDIKMTDDDEKCDIFTGEWVPNPDAPYYTNETCLVIHERQNCMKYGRPDTEFLKWKWKPDRCDLQVFDPFRFLDIVRDKSLAFVGDSLGRNQMESMICLLSRVENPIDVSPTSDQHFRRWRYVNYNFTLAYFWTQFLIRSEKLDSDGPNHTGLYNLYLDEPDESWTSQIDEFDYLVLNTGRWYLTPAFYSENRRVSGCHYCQLPNTTDLPAAYGYRRAIRTSTKAIERRERFNGVVFVRTLAPSHFENGEWNTGGDCVRRWPWLSSEASLDGVELEIYLTLMEELKAVERKSKKRFKLFDTTQAMLLRPDGHPSRFANETVHNDCVHWCLPGPIDTWADFLLHMIKNEAQNMTKERMLFEHEKIKKKALKF